MKTAQKFRWAACAAMITAALPAQDMEGGLLGLFNREPPRSAEQRPPALDPKRIINESNSFLKEREPELTAEEFAVYEKVSTMLTTSPALALRMLEALSSGKEPPNPAFAFILGNAYYGANDVERAEHYFRSAVTRFPSFLRAWNNLGILYYTKGRFAEALPCFSKAVALGDRDPVTFGLLGFCLEKEDDPVAAEVAYLHAISADAANTDWKEGLLRIYVNGKQYGRAESLVRNLIKKKPAETRYWLDYAGICMAQQRKAEAMVVLEEAQAVGAAGPDELLLLGDLYAEQNLTDAAIAIYQKVLGTKHALGEEKLLRFARLLVGANRLTEAEQSLSALPGELTPAGQLARLQIRAELLIARQQWQEARQQIDALLALAPLHGRGLLLLGRTYLAENDLARAALAFETAARVPDSVFPACLELANIEVKNRRYAKAVEHLERALSIEKSDAVADYLARVKALVPRESISG